MLYTIIDIEASSTSATFADIYEFAYMQVRRDLSIVRAESLYFFKPEWKIGAAHIHHLSREFLESHTEEFDENLVKMFTVMHNGIILGKNSDRFDIPAIWNFIGRQEPDLRTNKIYGTLDLQKFVAPHYRDWITEKTGVRETRKFGTLEDYMEMIGMSQQQVLDEFVKMFPDAERKSAHCAMYDVYMTYLITKYAAEHYGLKL